MTNLTMGLNESRFADIIWDKEPLSSTELTKKSEEIFGWKKSTSFTVLKRLCNKGIFKIEGGMVTSIISKEEFYSIQSEQFVEDTFEGSFPSFFAAFTRRNKLTTKEIDDIKKMIAEYEKK